MATREQAEKVCDTYLSLMRTYTIGSEISFNKVAYGQDSPYDDNYYVYVWVSGMKSDDLLKLIDGVEIRYIWNVNKEFKVEV